MLQEGHACQDFEKCLKFPQEVLSVEQISVFVSVFIYILGR